MTGRDPRSDGRDRELNEAAENLRLKAFKYDPDDHELRELILDALARAFTLGVTLARVVAAFLLAMAAGSAIGYAMGRNALIDLCIGQRRVDLVVELIDDVGGCALGRTNPLPPARFITRKELANRGNTRQHFQACRGRHR